MCAGPNPDRIVAELRLYGFWGVDGLFAELLRILEEASAMLRRVGDHFAR
jgi:hypothetical protein